MKTKQLAITVYLTGDEKAQLQTVAGLAQSLLDNAEWISRAVAGYSGGLFYPDSNEPMGTFALNNLTVNVKATVH